MVVSVEQAVFTERSAFCSSQTFNCLDRVYSRWGKQSALSSSLTEKCVSPEDILSETPKVMFIFLLDVDELCRIVDCIVPALYMHIP